MTIPFIMENNGVGGSYIAVCLWAGCLGWLHVVGLLSIGSYRLIICNLPIGGQYEVLMNSLITSIRCI